MQVTCRLCRLRFDLVDPSLTEVRCPRCEGKVKIDPEMLQQPAATKPPVGCPGCLNLLGPAEQYPVHCRYCGYHIQQEEGERLGASLKGLEGRLKSYLMAGGSPSEAVRLIEQLGVTSEQAFGYVDKRVLEVPFERHPLWKQNQRVTTSPTCDSCGVAGQLSPYQATWNVREEELKRYREGWGGFHDTELKQSRKALYFLCKDCTKLGPERFAGGYPARNGFIWNRLEAVKATFPPPEPVELVLKA